MRAIDLIRRTGMTTTQIAKAIGCTAHTIRNYERGNRRPSSEQFDLLVDLSQKRGLSLLATDFMQKKDAA